MEGAQSTSARPGALDQERPGPSQGRAAVTAAAPAGGPAAGGTCLTVGLLGFADPRMEAEWTAEFNASRLGEDRFYSLVMLPIGLVFVPRINDYGAAGIAWTLLFTAAGASVMFLQWRRPALYVRRRVALVAALRLFRLALNATLMLPRELTIVPPAPLPAPYTLDFAFRMLIRVGVPLTQGMGYWLPLKWHLPVGALATIGYGGGIRPRCAVECARFQGTGERYTRLVASLARLAALAPTTAAASAAPALPSGAAACWAFHACVVVCLGFLLPACLLAASEAASRQWFLESRGGSSFLPSPRRMWLGQAATGALAAALALQAVLVAAQMGAASGAL